MYSAAKLREIVKEQGRHHNWLADRTGYARETVTRYLSGTYPISDEFAHKAALVLGIPARWLLEEEAKNAA